jgi:hypothetical protein
MTTPHHERDGDATFELRVTQGPEAEQTLHVEIVCVYPPEFEAAQAACSGNHSQIPIPHQGDLARVAGPLVPDLVHDTQYHELEIHPLVTLSVVP